jgi:hypothetical protein
MPNSSADIEISPEKGLIADGLKSDSKDDLVTKIRNVTTLDSIRRVRKDARVLTICRLPWGGAFSLAFGVLANVSSRTGGQPILSFCFRALL